MLPFLTARQTEREAAFVSESLALQPGGAVLDLGCGYGRHAMELAGKGVQVTGLDLSLPLLDSRGRRGAPRRAHRQLHSRRTWAR